MRRDTVQVMSTKQVMSPAEAGVLLGQSKNWVWRHCVDGTLPHKLVNGRYYLTRAELIRDGWLEPDQQGTGVEPGVEREETTTARERLVAVDGVTSSGRRLGRRDDSGMI